MRWRAAALLAAAAAAGLMVPVSAAQAQTDPAKTSKISGQMAAWQEREARLFHIGWRLVTGNADYCQNSGPAIGILLHDAATYSDPDGVRTALGLQGDIAVQAVAPGSPADIAGMRTNDTLDSVNEVMVGEQFPVSDPLWQRLTDIRAAMAAELALSAPAMFGWISPDGSPTWHGDHSGYGVRNAL